MKLTAQCKVLVTVPAIFLVIAFSLETASAQVKNRLSIATGGTGGRVLSVGRRTCRADIEAPARR